MAVPLSRRRPGSYGRDERDDALQIGPGLLVGDADHPPAAPHQGIFFSTVDDFLSDQAMSLAINLDGKSNIQQGQVDPVSLPFWPRHAMMQDPTSLSREGC